MAYADKITTMKRCAIINADNGEIEWEGVNIEGEIILKEVTTGAIKTIGQHEFVTDFIDTLEMFTDFNNLLLVYQDQEKTWCPREDNNVWFNRKNKRYELVKIYGRGE